MPWTRRQVEFLESSGSPLTPAQKGKMNAELHADPSMGHEKKGSSAMKKEMKKAPFHMTRITHHDDGSHTVEHEPHMKMKGSGAFMEKGDGMSYSAGTGKELMSKLGKHLGIGAAASPKDEEGEMHAAEHEPPSAEVEEDSEGV
jgi:hypothetical protein